MINIYLVVEYRYIITLKLCSSILLHSCCPKQLTEKDKLWPSAIVRFFFKKNLSASRPSEHPTQEEKCQNALFLGGIIERLQRQNILMALKRIPRWCQQDDAGKKPTIIYYTYIISST